MVRPDFPPGLPEVQKVVSGVVGCQLVKIGTEKSGCAEKDGFCLFGLVEQHFQRGSLCQEAHGK